MRLKGEFIGAAIRLIDGSTHSYFKCFRGWAFRSQRPIRGAVEPRAPGSAQGLPSGGQNSILSRSMNLPYQRLSRLIFQIGFLAASVSAPSPRLWAAFGVEVRSTRSIENALMESIKTVDWTYESFGQSYVTSIGPKSPSRLSTTGVNGKQESIYLAVLELPLPSTGTVHAVITTSDKREVRCSIDALRFPRSLTVRATLDRSSKDLTCSISGDWSENVYQTH